jgi:hypothetical protein
MKDFSAKPILSNHRARKLSILCCTRATGKGKYQGFSIVIVFLIRKYFSEFEFLVIPKETETARWYVF